MLDFLRRFAPSGRFGGRRRALAGAIAVAAVGGLVLMPAGRSLASSSTFTVDTTGDPLAGSCAGGSGSLRQCLLAAAAVTGPDTVAFGVDGVFTLAQGELVVDSDVIILGHGPANTVLDGNDADRILFFGAGTTVELSGVTIRNGTSVRGTGNDGGVGAGLYNAGTLSLTDVAVRDNRAVAVADGMTPSVSAGGGGIFNAGHLTIADSTISGNTATATTMEPFGLAGALGGGIMSVNPDGTLTLTNVTVSGNRALASADTGDTRGGGIFVATPGTATNVTITANTAAMSSGVDEHGELPFTRSIIAGNSGGPNCASPASAGYNLDDDGSCFSESTDLHANPLLAPLSFYGGFTQTHALLGGSPAIDAGAGCPPPGTDQRGVSRPQGAACDIGAFELETAATATTCVVTGRRAGPPKQQDVTVQDTTGLMSIFNIQITNGTVAVPSFTSGTGAPVVVTATKSDPTRVTVWSFDATDSRGRTTHCS